MQSESVYCDQCRGPHRICPLCAQMVSYDSVSKLTMDAHSPAHHYCLETPAYAARSLAMAEHWARQERQMISDCRECPGRVVFRYAGEPTLYDDVNGQVVHNCARATQPTSPEPTPIRQSEPTAPVIPFNGTRIPRLHGG